MRAADASVLRETDAAVRRKLARFDLADRRFDETAIFASLLFGDGCFQILNFRDAFSNEDDECDIRNSADPGIADHLRIERQQLYRVFRVSAGRRFPIDQTPLAVELTEGVYISDELVFARKVRIIFTCRFCSGR